MKLAILVRTLAVHGPVTFLVEPIAGETVEQLVDRVGRHIYEADGPGEGTSPFDAVEIRVVIPAPSNLVAPPSGVVVPR